MLGAMNNYLPIEMLFSFCLLLLYMATPTISACPASAQYLLVATNQCYRTCPWFAPNYYFSYLPTNTC